ncbi:hypothetical protein MAE01_09780 [Microbacterium aerolatum]|uniref:Uncharacterized protein n=1 Tax=Microbacterium aerolatum TaxID=153731 RepID=A0A511ACI7_9MICO|nr:hypothetical protein MAE01_09780 [Microbacterium aerolatum]
MTCTETCAPASASSSSARMVATKERRPTAARRGSRRLLRCDLRIIAGSGGVPTRVPSKKVGETPMASATGGTGHRNPAYRRRVKDWR